MSQVVEQVEWSPGRRVSTIRYGSGEVAVLLAHGAGTDQHHQMIVSIAAALASEGLRVVTFNYPYTEAGRRRPDRPEVLLACHRAVLESVRAGVDEAVFLAGRSMGGRLGTMLAANGEAVGGVVAYAYPLHPAGRPERLRIEHLADIHVPMLCFQGSRDALSRPELYDLHVRPLRFVTTVDMAGADHSFRGKDWKPERLYPFLAAHTLGWIEEVRFGRPERDPR
jgi:predicted alpha/beta-hydrolase family hydrolase